MATVNDLISGFKHVGENNGFKNDPATKPEKTQFWINVGVEKNGKLVSLPMGIPLDKLEARRIPGSSSKNTEFRQLRMAEADLWKKMQEVMSKLQPGETVVLPFTVELRRCEADEVLEDQDEATNPFAVGPLTLK